MSKLTNKQLKKLLSEYIKEQQRYTRKVFGSNRSDIDKIFKEHQKQIEKLYRDFIDGKVNKNIPFRYKEYPHLQVYFASIQKSLQAQLYANVLNDITIAWDKSNNDIDKIVKFVYPNTKGKQIAKYLDHNKQAQNAFINRKISTGRTLKGRTWLLSKRYLRDIEDTLTIGIQNGDSADVLGRRINRYLNDPESKVNDINKIADKDAKSLLEQRVLDEKGRANKTLRSSKYHAKMLARNETNLAYRNAETERMNKLDFVVGQEIRLSNAHPREDICDYVCGKYSKDFIWNSWHPECLCYRVFILKTIEELEADNERILRGEDPTSESVNKVTDIPDNAKEYFKANYERFSKYKNKPYFLDENKDWMKKLRG